MKALFWCLLCLSLGAAVEHITAQEPARMDPKADPSYEVATVKPSDVADTSSGFQLRGNRAIVRNETVDAMLTFAFGVQQRQLVNLPSWTGQAHFDVNGIADREGQPSVQQMRSMVRKLLKARFELAFHEETRELPVYVLSLAKSGPKLTKAADADGLPDQTGNRGQMARFQFTNNTMDDLTSFLQFELDRPVLNQTKLSGRYTFSLQWTPDLSTKTSTDEAPPMFRAVQEQLGLKLEATKQQAPVMVIDHVQLPEAN